MASLLTLRHVLTLTFVVSLIVTLAIADPMMCPYSVCSCTQDTIDCSNLNLTSMPKLTFSGLPQTTLDISGNDITTLAPGDLPANLRELRSLDNPLTDISAQAFQDCSSSLRSIIVEYSSLSLASLSDALSVCTSLETVSLGHNNISSFDDFVFPNSVSHIFLDDNVMTSVPDVSYLPRLQEFDVASNAITSLSGLVLPTSLTDLYIENNLITSLPPLSFPSNDSNLDIININNNPISQVDVDAFTWTPELTNVDMANANLTRLPMALLKLTKLDHLTLTDNHNLVCTCAEQELMEWYHQLQSDGYEVYIDGDCMTSSISFFLDELAPQCNQIIG